MPARLATLLTVLLLAGCGGSSSPTSKTRPRLAEAEPEKKPEKKPDRVVKHTTRKPAPKPANPLVKDSDEDGIIRVAFIKNNKPVANVLAHLKVAPKGSTAPEGETITVTRSRAAFVPPLQVIGVGGTLRLRSADPQASFQAIGPIFFTIMVNRGEMKDIPLRSVGLVTLLSKDTQPAYILVTDHPYYAVGGTDGTLALPKLEPGSYDVVLRHPRGNVTVTQPVTLQAGKGVSIRLTVP